MEEKTVIENTLIRKRVRIKEDKYEKIELESLKRKKEERWNQRRQSRLN
jgi:hypothetical protein